MTRKRPQPEHVDLIKRLKAFAKEAMLDNAAYSRLGQDDNSYDALALADIAMAMVSGLKTGTTPSDYATYAGPSPDGMDDLLERPLTAEVAEAWLKMATQALEDIR
jgi:hypothetical protein